MNDHIVELTVFVIYGLALFLGRSQLIAISILMAEQMIPAAGSVTKTVEAIFVCIWMMSAAFRVVYWYVQTLFRGFADTTFDPFAEVRMDL